MDGFIFYKSFYEASKYLSDEEYRALMDGIFEYQFEGAEPSLVGIAGMAFALIKPQLDANTKRQEDGAKGAPYGKLGGRPKKNPTGVIAENPTVVLSETPKEKEKEKDKEKEKEKDKEKDKEGEKDTSPTLSLGTNKNVKMTVNEHDQLRQEYPREYKDYIENLSYYLNEHPEKSYASHYQTIKRWIEKDRKDGKAKGFDPNRGMVMSGEDYDAAMRRNIERGLRRTST